MFETLSGRLEEIFARLRSRGRLRPEDVDEALGEIRRALLAADVATPVVTAFRDRGAGGGRWPPSCTGR